MSAFCLPNQNTSPTEQATLASKDVSLLEREPSGYFGDHPKKVENFHDFSEEILQKYAQDQTFQNFKEAFLKLSRKLTQLKDQHRSQL